MLIPLCLAYWRLVLKASWKMTSVIGLALGLVLFATYSRSAYLGVLLSLGVFLFLSVRSQRLRRYTVIAGIVGVVIAAGLVGILRNNNHVQNALFHSDETSQSAQSSNTGRVHAWEQGARDIVHEPLGRGPGTAGPASARNDQPARIAENYYLQIDQAQTQ